MQLSIVVWRLRNSYSYHIVGYRRHNDGASAVAHRREMNRAGRAKPSDGASAVAHRREMNRAGRAKPSDGASAVAHRRDMNCARRENPAIKPVQWRTVGI
jgi:hypothetical protein